MRNAFLSELLCISLLWLSQNVLAKPEPVQEFNFSNGLKLLVKVDKRSPVVVSQVWYKVGSSYEPAGTTGLSHMVEHMMFKGTPSYPAGEFSKIMSANGAAENAFTGRDFTSYFQRLANDRLELSFKMEADRMRNLLLPEQEFLKEREVVLEERRARVEDEPQSLLAEYFMSTAFTTSGYHNPVIGWKSDIENYSIEDLKNWYQAWYAPNNAIVVVAGDVEPTAVFKLAKQYFEPLLPSNLKKAKPRPEVAQLGTRRIVIKQPAKLPALMMGYKVPSLVTLNKDEQWEAYALEVLAQVLDGGESARLSKYLVRGEEIASTISAGYDNNSRLTTLFSISGIPTEQHSVADLETAIKKQIQQLQTTLVSQEELNKVKIAFKAAKVYERDSVFYQAMQIGTLESVGLNWQLIDSYFDNILAVTPEQVQAVAKKYLQEDLLTVGILDPLPLEAKAPPKANLKLPHGDM